VDEDGELNAHLQQVPDAIVLWPDEIRLRFPVST
jgi:hypothetical protein